MKTVAETRLFWFLKEDAEIDLSHQSCRDMYVQQVITRGRTSDVKRLLDLLGYADFAVSFTRIKNFVPKEIRRFWEDSFGNFD